MGTAGICKDYNLAMYWAKQNKLYESIWFRSVRKEYIPIEERNRERQRNSILVKLYLSLLWWKVAKPLYKILSFKKS